MGPSLSQGLTAHRIWLARQTQTARPRKLLSRQGHADAKFGSHGPGLYDPGELKYYNAPLRAREDAVPSDFLTPESAKRRLEKGSWCGVDACLAQEQELVPRVVELLFVLQPESVAKPKDGVDRSWPKRVAYLRESPEVPLAPPRVMSWASMGDSLIGALAPALMEMGVAGNRSCHARIWRPCPGRGGGGGGRTKKAR